MEYNDYELYYSLKEEINKKRENLNELVNGGIDEEVIQLSQELDRLISEYLKLELSITKK